MKSARHKCIAAKARFRRLIESGVVIRVIRATFLKVAEVVLMQHHAVVLETEPPGELRVGRYLLWVDLTVAQ